MSAKFLFFNICEERKNRNLFFICVISSIVRADLQADGNIFPKISLNRVGIKGVKKRIEVHRKTGEKILYINPVIDAFVQLPDTQRAIHMSRSVESIESAINQSVIEPVNNIEEFARRIVDSLLLYHDYSTIAEVNMTGDLIIQSSNGNCSNGEQGMSDNKRKINLNQKVYGILCNAKATRIKEDLQKFVYELEIGISAYGMTCCPCAQQMNREYSHEMLKSTQDLNLTDTQIEKILSIIPIASHNQRALATITLKTNQVEHELIDLFELVEAIESGMSGKISSILKRPEEASLVRSAHIHPYFVEDAVRLIALNLNDSCFSRISDDTFVNIKIESYESIHAHNAYAELTTTFKEIRQSAIEYQKRG